MEKPTKKKLLDVNANLLTENEYARHKERVTAHNKLWEAFNEYHEEVLDKIEREPYRVVWDICDKFKLGAGGCPDSLVIDYIKELQQQLKEEEHKRHREIGVIRENYKKVIDGMKNDYLELHDTLLDEREYFTKTKQQLTTLKQIILDDVPHEYQGRLLEVMK